jgi:hypothetical protein
VDGERPGWLERSRSWSTTRQLAFATLVVVVTGIVVSALIPDGRQEGKVTIAFADPASTTTPVAVETIAMVEVLTSEQSTTVTLAPTTAAPVSLGGLSALEVLDSIPVEPEHSEGYDRNLFAIWSDLDDDGCDTRAEVLMHESLTIAQVDIFGCFVIAGDWFSAYDNVTLSDPAELDIDHLVPLNEAWKSGAWAWTPAQRIAYANDISDSRTLVAVTAASNRSKGDRDPAMWLPDEAAVCSYISDWLAVKARWRLTIDDDERNRIFELLTGTCVDERVAPWPSVSGD